MGPCPLCHAIIWQQVIVYPTKVHVNEVTLTETRIALPEDPVVTSTCENGHVTKS